MAKSSKDTKGAKETKDTKGAKSTKSKRTSWFDEKSHTILIKEYVQQLSSFIETMADGKVDDSELEAQQERLIALMKEVEPQLDDALHEKVTRLLCELAAYDAMQMIYMMQEARPKTAFRG
jgi:hypothetical protein